MTEANRELSPADEAAALRFFTDLGMHTDGTETPDIPHIAARNLHMGVGSEQAPRTDIPASKPATDNMSGVSDPYDLLTPEAREELNRKLEENDRVYRQGLNDARDLPLG